MEDPPVRPQQAEQRAGDPAKRLGWRTHRSGHSKLGYIADICVNIIYKCIDRRIPVSIVKQMGSTHGND